MRPGRVTSGEKGEMPKGRVIASLRKRGEVSSLLVLTRERRDKKIARLLSQGRES